MGWSMTLLFADSYLQHTFFDIRTEFTWRTISQEICVGHTRQQIFASKIISYLAAFNIMAIVYPVAGCIREYGKFGIGDIGFFSIM